MWGLVVGLLLNSFELGFCLRLLGVLGWMVWVADCWGFFFFYIKGKSDEVMRWAEWGHDGKMSDEARISSEQDDTSDQLEDGRKCLMVWSDWYWYGCLVEAVSTLTYFLWKNKETTLLDAASNFDMPQVRWVGVFFIFNGGFGQIWNALIFMYMAPGSSA